MEQKLFAKGCLFLFLTFTCMMAGYAQSAYVGESVYLTLPSVPGTIGGAAWTCDLSNNVFVSGNQNGATATINSYFSGTATITCTYVYSYYIGTTRHYSSTQHARYYLTCRASKVTLNEQKVTLKPGQEISLTYTNSSGYALPYVLWTTSDKKIAMFDGYDKDRVFGEKTMVIKAVEAGNCIITCVGNTGYEDPTCEVIVEYIPPTNIILSSDAVSVAIGKSKTISYTLVPDGASAKINWSSSDESIVKVSSAGKITGVSEGNATITATTDNGLSASCVITVASAPNSVLLPYNVEVVQGYSTQIEPTLSPVNSISTYKWKTEDKSIAEVTSNGKITGKNAGTTTITVTTENGLTASCIVTVKNAPEGVDYRNAKIRVKVVKDLVDETLKYIK